MVVVEGEEKEEEEEEEEEKEAEEEEEWLADNLRDWGKDVVEF
jgi:hypothetical protein